MIEGLYSKTDRDAHFDAQIADERFLLRGELLHELGADAVRQPEHRHRGRRLIY